MRKRDGWLVGVTLACAACVTAQPRTAWRNAADPGRNYDRDNQECEAIAASIVASMPNSMWKLVFHNKQWERCMIGRDWKQVLEDALPPPIGSSPTATLENQDTRWLRVRFDQESAAYLDTTRIERRADGIVAVWMNYRYKTPRGVSGLFFVRSIDHFEFDCVRSRTRATSTAKYDGNGGLVFSSQMETEWSDVIPESTGEALLRALCSLPLKRDRP